MEVADMRMLRWMCGVSRKDRIRNEFIRGSDKVGPYRRKMQECRLRWFGHIERSSEDYVGKRVRKLVVKGRRKRGRPRLHWKDKNIQFLIECDFIFLEKGDNQTYWGIQLDQDLLETIVSIYPEWFKDCNFCISNMAEGNTHYKTENGKIIIPLYNTRDMESPPKAIVDDASLQKAMNKNKESLKVKLMLRRPLNQLVEQGIMPSLKTSPHFHEQRQKLERAKMGDILKNKIQRRPDRQELIQQHILEDTKIDPSLQDKQRQLKKARLADDLNDRLSHRPGPLELIKGNILQTDEKFAQAVKEGQIPFKRTCEGQTQKHPPPRFLFEEDSGSEGAYSPPDATDQSQNRCGQNYILMYNSRLTIDPEKICSNCTMQAYETWERVFLHCGPPNAQKNQSSSSPSSSSSSNAETSYELLLQQQQLFLQWQLEWQQKYPQIILPATQKSNGDQGTVNGSIQINTPSSDQCINQESSAIQSRNISKLEDMKGISENLHYFYANSHIPSLEISGASTPMQDSPESIDLKSYKEDESINNNMCMSHIPNHISGVSSSLNREVNASSNKSRKKSKSKSQPKTRTIKFHEYKGPPNAQKNQSSSSPSSSSSSNAETSYELLLQQQQLFLQWQLEWQQKYPQIILPATQKSNGDQGTVNGSIQINTPSSDQCINQESSAIQSRNISKLEDMKVSDLKAELKKRNLPVSGSKPQLIERLKPYSDISNSALSSLSDTVTPASSTNSLPLTISSIFLDTSAATTAPITTPSSVTTTVVATTSVTTVSGTPSITNSQNESEIFSPMSVNTVPTKMNSNAVCEDVKLGIYKIPSVTQVVTSRPSSVAPMEVDTSPSMIMEAMDINETASTPITNEEIVKLQQKKIEELQRELQRMNNHRDLILKYYIKQNYIGTDITFHISGTSGITNVLPSSQPSSAAVKANLAAFLHNQHSLVPITNVSISSPVISQVATSQPVVSIPARVLTAQPNVDQIEYNSKQANMQPLSNLIRNSSPSPKAADSYPNGINHKRNSSLSGFNNMLASKQTEKEKLNESPFITKPPPDYNEATKQLVKSQQTTNSHFINQPSNRSGDEGIIKSQAVDDVLEILIKNGELPPSAAQEPPLLNSIKTVKIPKSSSNISSSKTGYPSNGSQTTGSCNLQSIAPSLVSGHVAMTSPPSTILGDQENNANTPLDFDFHLDLDDIEIMELGGVLVGEGTGNSVSKLESNQMQSVGNNEQNMLEENGNPVVLSDNTVNMDVELSDWLDVMIPSTSAATTTSNICVSNNILQQNNNNNSYRNDPDPLLSTLANNNDLHDLFSIEDLDFKTSPNDLNIHTWDKIDFAT
ncbi:MKL/myocardin-like protein 1 [Centruroides sculpturatus]|uniref:MKL/myocardin-like protein 1 n=1 Tax=Centruroides sculpturatus TaxID=218467 RepID=UPI000C6D321E|nr:MKL/myocardin-like protein 1 [Centruroides sculpturatus]